MGPDPVEVAAVVAVVLLTVLTMFQAAVVLGVPPWHHGVGG